MQSGEVVPMKFERCCSAAVIYVKRGVSGLSVRFPTPDFSDFISARIEYLVKEILNLF